MSNMPDVPEEVREYFRELARKGKYPQKAAKPGPETHARAADRDCEAGGGSLEIKIRQIRRISAGPKSEGEKNRKVIRIAFISFADLVNDLKPAFVYAV